jgi:hypothetical protein
MVELASLEDPVRDDDPGVDLTGLTKLHAAALAPCRVLSATVQIDVEAEPRIWRTAFRHEFGHVLLLAHDTDDRSLMYEFSGLLGWHGDVTAADAARVRGRYRP